VEITGTTRNAVRHIAASVLGLRYGVFPPSALTRASAAAVPKRPARMGCPQEREIIVR
jgi:hypothetical protein